MVLSLPSRVANTFTPKAMEDLRSVVERCLDGTGSLNGALLQIWITGHRLAFSIKIREEGIGTVA